jgi:hypothetical protein
LLGKALGLVPADPSLTLDERHWNKCPGRNGFQIIFKAIMANPVTVAGVVKMIHGDEDITVVTGRTLI